MRPRTPELDSRILDAAARLFAGNRFHEVRMEDISAEASVGKGTIYRYFNDKEELYDALLDRAAQQIQARLDQELAGPDGPQVKLVRLVDAVMRFFDELPHLFGLIQQAEARVGTRHPWQAARDAINRCVLDLFKDGERTGAFSVRNPEVTSLLLLGGLRGIFRFGPRPRPTALAEDLVRTILFGANQLGRSGPM